MTTKEILIAARARIEGNWVKGGSGCAFLTLAFVARLFCEQLAEAFRVLCQAASTHDLIAWNDAPERTHAEVLAAFDKAIASLP